MLLRRSTISRRAAQRLGAQLHQTALAVNAEAEVPAARTIPQIDNGALFGGSCSAFLGGAARRFRRRRKQSNRMDDNERARANPLPQEHDQERA